MKFCECGKPGKWFFKDDVDKVPFCDDGRDVFLSSGNTEEDFIPIPEND